MKRHQLETLEMMVCAYGDGSGLHLVFDDGNWDRQSLEVQAEGNFSRGDWVAFAISKMLLEMPDQAYPFIKQRGWPAAIQEMIREDALFWLFADAEFDAKIRRDATEPAHP